MPPPAGAPIHARSRAPESIRGNRLMNVIDQAPQRVWRSSRRGGSSLPSHQVAVAPRKTAPQATLHVICANALHPILDAPWHHVLVAREEVHAPAALSAWSSSTLANCRHMSRAVGTTTVHRKRGDGRTGLTLSQRFRFS